MLKLMLAAGIAALVAVACETKSEPVSPAPSGGEAPAVAQELEIGCAMCVYHIEGVTACVPAVKVGETAMLLEGFTPEGEHVLCSGAKKAKVEGQVEGEKFVATKVELLP